MVDIRYCIVLSAIYIYRYTYICAYISWFSSYTARFITGEISIILGYLGIFTNVSLIISVPQCNDKT